MFLFRSLVINWVISWVDLTIIVLISYHFQSPVLCQSDDNSWCYANSSCGPKTWKGLCATGKSQSPINIRPGQFPTSPKPMDLIVNKDYSSIQRFLLWNKGHTIRLLLKEDGTSSSYLDGLGLPDGPYAFSHLHFHWGSKNSFGSEHRISGRAYPLEMHMVHRQVEDGKTIAVVGVLFRIGIKENSQLQSVVNNLNLVTTPGLKPSVTPNDAKVNLSALLPPRMKWVRYMGSLTTPPCTEGVIWTVFQHPVTISLKQMKSFRALKGPGNAKLINNFRPVQTRLSSKHDLKSRRAVIM